MMKREVQILMISALLLPVLSGAAEETMEERKRRITRKYLRERTEMTYSDDMVPSEREAENEALAESEQFREPLVDLEAEEPGRSIPRPPPRPAPRVENPNWLLSETEETDDPFADPYADPFATGNDEQEAKRSDPPTWGERRETGFYYDTLRERTSRQSSFGSFYEQPTGADDAAQAYGSYYSRTPSGEEAPGARPQGQGAYGSPDRQESAGREYVNPWSVPDTYSRSTVLPPPQPAPGAAVPPQNSRSTPYTSPFSRTQEGQKTWSGYTPYQSPYRSPYEQQQQRQQQWGQESPSAGEYRRQDPFQQWKRRGTDPVNPMSDDAYVDEMMPQTRR
jgi:hypothetical protein